jgi:hypothetical protein
LHIKCSVTDCVKIPLWSGAYIRLCNRKDCTMYSTIKQRQSRKAERKMAIAVHMKNPV